jgi:hypothetical protein
MRWVIDFETFLFQDWKSEAGPVILGAYCIDTKEKRWITPDTVVSFLEFLLGNDSYVLGFALAFDTLQFFRCLGCRPESVSRILEAYARGLWICVRAADKLTAIQNGTYEIRTFHLQSSYFSYLQKDIADSKGGNHFVSGLGYQSSKRR